jgi:nucleoside phosphorylase
VHTERACNAFRGSLTHLLFVGVAGGRKDVRHGDVVLADAVYDYQTGRDEAGGFRPRFKTHHSAYALVQRAQAVARRGRWPQAVRPEPPPTTPDAFVKPIAAGGRVIASERSDAARLIAEHCGDAVAVETVSFDFLYAAYVNPAVTAGVVVGVSDLLGDKSEAADADRQDTAARHAAAFAFALIAETAPTPTGRIGTGPGRASDRPGPDG